MLNKDSWVNFLLQIRRLRPWGWGEVKEGQSGDSGGKELEEETKIPRVGGKGKALDLEMTPSKHTTQCGHLPTHLPWRAKLLSSSPEHPEVSANRLGNLATLCGLRCLNGEHQPCRPSQFCIEPVGNIPKNGAVDKELLLQFKYMNLPT